jgi:hypothetical protein
VQRHPVISILAEDVCASLQQRLKHLHTTHSMSIATFCLEVTHTKHLLTSY